MACITGTIYCGSNFGQPFVQYLDLSSRFNKTAPPLTVLTKQLHCCRLSRRTSSGRSNGHQKAWISIRLTTRSGAFFKSQLHFCQICDIDHRLICEWCRCVQHILLRNQPASDDSVSVTVSARKVDTLTIRLKYCHCQTENEGDPENAGLENAAPFSSPAFSIPAFSVAPNKLLLCSCTVVRLVDFIFSLISE